MASLVFNDKERIGDWVASHVGQLSSWGGYYAMGAELEGEPISGIVFNNFTDSSATVHLAVSKPKRILSELLDHAFVYAFKTCKLRRLTGLVEAQNAKSLKIISLRANKLSGTIPSDGFASNQNLSTLDLAQNGVPW